MYDFIGFIEPVRFINEGGEVPGPPPGGAAWDNNTPWDNNVYWS